MMVKDLRPGLTECGKIKIGNKGREIRSKNGNVFQPPQKLDHFVITTLERGPDGNFNLDQGMHARFGDQPKELPVMLLFNDPWLSFQTTYAAMRGGARFCTGDGERAERIDEQGEIHEVECTCERLNQAYAGKEKCKINGTLSVMIEGATVVGGIWKLRTTSINTCQGIASSLALLSTITEGHIAGVPLMLTVRPKASVTPQGTTTTVYVVGLEFRGTIDELRRLAHDKALSDATFGQRMERVEEQARAMLSAPRPISDDETTDLVDEFYPEEAARGRGLQLAPRPEDGPDRPKPRTLDQLVDQHTSTRQQEAQGEPTAGQGTLEAPEPTSAPSEAGAQADDPSAYDGQDGGDLLGDAATDPEPTVALRLPKTKRAKDLPLTEAGNVLLGYARQCDGEAGAAWITEALALNPWVRDHTVTFEMLSYLYGECMRPDETVAGDGAP